MARGFRFVTAYRDLCGATAMFALGGAAEVERKATDRVFLAMALRNEQTIGATVSRNAAVPLERRTTRRPADHVHRPILMRDVVGRRSAQRAIVMADCSLHSLV